MLANPFSYLIKMIAFIVFHLDGDTRRMQLLTVIFRAFRDPGVLVVDAVIHNNAFEFQQILFVLHNFISNTAKAAFPLLPGLFVADELTADLVVGVIKVRRMPIRVGSEGIAIG